jgi:hypothetical protein
MNTELTRFIVNTFEKEADILIEPQNDDSKSIESFNVAIDDINIDELDSRFDRGESTLRNSRLEKQRSSLQFPSSIGFKTMWIIYFIVSAIIFFILLLKQII